MNKKGSIAIEASIVFTVFLIIVSVVITSMNVQKTDIVMQEAIEQSNEDISVLIPFTVLGAETVNSLTSDADLGKDAVSAYNNICHISDDLGDLMGVSAEELIMNGYLSRFLKKDILAEFDERSSGLIFRPESISVNVCYCYEEQIIEEYISYTVHTPVGNIMRTHYGTIPFWGIYNTAINNVEFIEEDSSNEDDPWGLDNLSRGSYFEDKYGANLPHTFPVLTTYNDGDCESIVSIDLTKQKYENDSKITSKINDEVNSLSEFNGVDINIQGNNYSIKESDIKNKTLKIIIPQNTPDDRCQTLIEAVNDVEDDDINIIIIKDGSSN
ncbi:MAG: hypothetical protein J6U54_04715 [Clostridiales bacterium]|nr:hypothetical protein [Clostridiales bacterium]